MITQNNRILMLSETSAAMAGPGHNPAKPQPRPNKIAPEISCLSMTVLVGSEKVRLNSGAERLIARKKPGIVTIKAPPITNARVGSHVPKRSKNANTRCGLSIFDTAKPKPNSKPEIKETHIIIAPPLLQ